MFAQVLRDTCKKMNFSVMGVYVTLVFTEIAIKATTKGKCVRKGWRRGKRRRRKCT